MSFNNATETLVK